MQLNLNKFDPIKGIETHLAASSASSAVFDLNKFDPIKGIETLSQLLANLLFLVLFKQI